MLLYGASGHAKVIIDSLRSTNTQIAGIFDDDLSKKRLYDFKIFGKYDKKLMPDECIIISIGENKTRKNISTIIKHNYGLAIHNSAILAQDASIEIGTVILHGSILQPGVRVGRHCIINTKASIDHDCIIGDFVHISPNSTLCGGVTVDEGTHIGAGAVIIPNIKIGKWSIIGAGSVIIKDVPDYSVVVGNPGRVIKRI